MNSSVEVVDHLEEGLAERADVLDEPRRQILVNAARANIIGVEPGAGCALIEVHELLALLEAPERRGQRADIQGLGRGVEQVRKQPADLEEENPDQLGAARHLDLEQLLDGQAEGMFVVDRRHIVEPVEIGDVLDVGPGLHQLLGAAVQQPDMRVDPLDDLAVEFEHEAQHAVRGRMLRTEVDREVAEVCCSVIGALAFSSPGRAAMSMASQGDKKSQLRNSCVNRTGWLTTRFSRSFHQTSTNPVIGKSLRMRMPLEPVIGEDSAQVGMAGEQDAVKVVGFPLEPVGGGKHRRQRRDRGRLVGHGLDPDSPIVFRRKQVDHHVEALRPRGVIDPAKVKEAHEGAARIIAQEAHDLDDVLALDRDGQFVEARPGPCTPADGRASAIACPRSS